MPCGYCTQELFDILFWAPQLTLAFHKEVHKDPDACVGPWVDDKREVSYRMAPDLPTTVRAIIGIPGLPKDICPLNLLLG